MIFKLPTSREKVKKTSTKSSSKKKTSRKLIDIDELWFKPDRILGATDRLDDKITFRIKVKDSDEYEIVPSKLANIACPELVIEFYQKHLVFTE